MQATKQKTIDPVCGMEVDNSSEFKAGYQGKTYYFCNQQDKQEFQQHPGKYVKESSTNTSESK